MDLFNSVCTRTADILLNPFANWPLLGLVLWGVVVGSLMTFVYGRTSNQTALSSVVDRTRANLLALGLFRDDLGVAFQAQVELFKLVGLRLWYSIPPVLVMILPFFVVLCQLALRYEYLPLVRGERANVYLHLSELHWESFRNTSLQTSEGITVETEGLRDDRTKTIAWRVRSDTGVSGFLTWQLGEQTVEKALAATTAPSRLSVVSQVRADAPSWNQALNPAESSLPADGAVKLVRVEYPNSRITPVFGWSVPWWATFVVVSMAAAYMVGAIVKVKF